MASSHLSLRVGWIGRAPRLPAPSPPFFSRALCFSSSPSPCSPTPATAASKLHLYSTTTKQKELFRPLEPGKVGVYVCGVTAYDLSHIGHVAYDVLYRYLRYLKYEVCFVWNFTDVDDKKLGSIHQGK